MAALWGAAAAPAGAAPARDQKAKVAVTFTVRPGWV
jgi:hypothetical protein